MGVYGCVLVGWLVVVGWLVWVAGGYMKCTLVGMVGLVSIALAMAADAECRCRHWLPRVT